MLYGKKGGEGLCRGDYIKNCRSGYYPGLSRWSLSVLTSVLIREKQRIFDTYKGEGDKKTERETLENAGLEDWSDISIHHGVPAATKHQQRQRREFP